MSIIEKKISITYNDRKVVTFPRYSGAIPTRLQLLNTLKQFNNM